MPLIRWFWRALAGLIRALFRTATGLLLLAALALNLAMVVLPAVFNAVSGLVWSAVSVVSSATAVRRETMAMTTAALRPEADDLARTRTRLAAAETDLQTARARTVTVESENRRLVAERDRMGRRLAASEDDLGTSRRRLATVEGENVRLQTSVRTSEARVDTMMARQARASAEAGSITRRMQARSIRMISRNTASTFVEALPIIGGVTVVGTLAWDVHDTCQQLTDLQELRTALSLDDTGRSDLEGRWCGLSPDEILGRLVGRATAEERACVLARVRTQTLDPPDCVAFPVTLPEYSDPLTEPAPIMVPLPEYSFD